MPSDGETFADRVAVIQFMRLQFRHDAVLVHNVTPLGGHSYHIKILLDEDDGDAGTPVEVDDNAPDGQLLLLAAGPRAGPFLESWKQAARLLVG